MSEMVETDLGRFPKDWPFKPVGEVFDTQLGKMLSQKAQGGDDPKPYLRNKNVQWGYIEVSDVLTMDFNAREKAKFILRPGDLMVCEGGVVGRAALWSGGISECYYQKALHRLRPTNGSITNEFMFYWLRFAFEIQNFYGVSGASSTIAHLPAAQLRALEVPLPPLPEQKKIAHILSTVQRAIEAQERIIQTTIELKKALMHKLFTEGLRNEPQKQTEIGPVPESWTPITLGELCEKPNGALQTGPFGSQLHKREYQEGGIAVVNPTHLAGNRINHENVPRISEAVAQRLGKHRLRKFDILFARRGEIGRQGLVTEAEETWLCGTGCFLVRASKPFIDNRFLALYFATDRLVKWLYSHAAGAIMPNLNNSVMQRLPVFYPDLETQTTVIKTFATIEQKLSAAASRQTELQDLLRTLLHELMTAKTRVHNIDFKIVNFNS